MKKANCVQSGLRHMCAVAVTRFSDRTWQENTRFREAHEFPGCVYNSPVVMGQSIAPDSQVFVLEMNNTRRRLLGIGCVTNRIRPCRVKVYDDPFYNQFTYTGRRRIDRAEMTENDLCVLAVLEELVFYGNGHLQRGKGIQCLPAAITECKELLRALGENLARRGSRTAAKERLAEGGVTVAWIESNRGLQLMHWLRQLFTERHGLS